MKINYIVRILTDIVDNGYIEYEEFETEKQARDYLNRYHEEIRKLSKIFKVQEVSNAKP